MIAEQINTCRSTMPDIDVAIAYTIGKACRADHGERMSTAAILFTSVFPHPILTLSVPSFEMVGVFSSSPESSQQNKENNAACS